MSPRILNDPPLPPGPENAAEVAQALAERMLAALGAATDGSGRVNYPRLAASGAFAEAIEAARRLGSISLATLEARASKLAFWINVYNALVLHGIVALGVRRSVARVWNFFGRARYRIDGLVFSVDAIEHGVLRGNRRR